MIVLLTYISCGVVHQFKLLCVLLQGAAPGSAADLVRYPGSQCSVLGLPMHLCPRPQRQRWREPVRHHQHRLCCRTDQCSPSMVSSGLHALQPARSRVPGAPEAATAQSFTGQQFASVCHVQCALACHTCSVHVEVSVECIFDG